MGSTSRYRSPNEAAPDEKETIKGDGNEIDCKEDLRRISSSGRTVPNSAVKSFAQKEFWNLIPKEIDPKNEKLVAYVWNCVNIVWLMCVQDPPISMSWVEKGDIFDTSKYRSYTKNGTIVDFCVWPLVLLDDSGPVLTKGIAQGK